MAEVKLTFTVDEKTANRIDKYQHERRLANKSEALRILVKHGLSQLETHNSDAPPTQKQINLVRQLCREKNIPAPEKFTLKSYAYFIKNNVASKPHKEKLTKF